MGQLLVAEKKKQGGKSPDGKVGKGGEKAGSFTSTRLYTADQVKLAKLAALRNESLAVTFHRLFGKTLDATLLAAAKGQVAELENRASVLEEASPEDA